MVGIEKNVFIATDIDQITKGTHKINKELLRISDILSI
jgi:hypothetical protein